MYTREQVQDNWFSQSYENKHQDNLFSQIAFTNMTHPVLQCYNTSDTPPHMNARRSVKVGVIISLNSNIYTHFSLDSQTRKIVNDKKSTIYTLLYLLATHAKKHPQVNKCTQNWMPIYFRAITSYLLIFITAWRIFYILTDRDTHTHIHSPSQCTTDIWNFLSKY